MRVPLRYFQRRSAHIKLFLNAPFGAGLVGVVTLSPLAVPLS
jgi:hypothetical protein